MEDYHTGKTIQEQANFIVNEYVDCKFIDCNFLNIDLSEKKFEDCKFINCNFSNQNWKGVQLQDIRFENCKMIGNNFDLLKPFLFELHFEQCNLSFSSFYALPLKGCSFIGSNLSEVDFTETNLEKAKITDNNLSRATFSSTNLTNADLRNSINYSIDPNSNKLKSCHFSYNEIHGLLQGFDILIE